MQILYQLTSPMDRHDRPARGGAPAAACCSATPRRGTEVRSSRPRPGPASIESAHDAALVVPELIRLAPLAEARGVEAIIIGCYSDPGIEALRELVDIPVVGPGAASLHLAAQLGTRHVGTDARRAAASAAWRRGCARSALRRSSPRCAASASP